MLVSEQMASGDGSTRAKGGPTARFGRALGGRGADKLGGAAAELTEGELAAAAAENEDIW